MLTLLLVTLAFVIAAARFVTKNPEEDWFIKILVTLSVGCLGMLVGLALATVITLAEPAYTPLTTTTQSYDLVAIKTSSSISGSFFLGTGSLNGTFYYLYYTEGPGGISFQKLPMERVLVHEGSGEAKVVITNRFWQGNTFTLWDLQSYSSYDFYVPDGSIDRSINTSLP